MDLIMNWVWWALYAGAHAAFIADFVWSQTDRRTISEFLWTLPLPRWIPYALAIGLFNGFFFGWSPGVAFASLGAFVLGHWSRFNR